MIINAQCIMHNAQCTIEFVVVFNCELCIVNCTLLHSFSRNHGSDSVKQDFYVKVN